MPETTQKTAMQILRDRINLRLSTSQYHVVTNELMVLRNLIDTELLAVEKQTIVDAVEWNYKSNMGEVYYNATFNTK